MYWVLLIIIVIVLAILIMCKGLPKVIGGRTKHSNINDYLGGDDDYFSGGAKHSHHVGDGHDMSCCGCHCPSCTTGGMCCGGYQAGGKFKLFMSPKLWEAVKSGKKTYDIRYMNNAIKNLQDGQEFVVQFSNMLDDSVPPPADKKIKVVLVSKTTDFKSFKDAYDTVKGDHVYPGYSFKDAEKEFNAPFSKKPEMKAKYDSEGTPFALLKFKLL